MHKECKGKEHERTDIQQQRIEEDGDWHKGGRDIEQHEAGLREAHIRAQVCTRLLQQQLLAMCYLVADGENEIGDACHEEGKHDIEQTAQMKAVRGGHTKGEDGKNEHIGRRAAQAVAVHLGDGAFHIYDGYGDEKRRRGVEEDVEQCPHVGPLCTEALRHLQKIMHRKEHRTAAEQPPRHLVASLRHLTRRLAIASCRESMAVMVQHTVCNMNNEAIYFFLINDRFSCNTSSMANENVFDGK